MRETVSRVKDLEVYVECTMVLIFSNLLTVFVCRSFKNLGVFCQLCQLLFGVLCTVILEYHTGKAAQIQGLVVLANRNLRQDLKTRHNGFTYNIGYGLIL